MGKIAVLILFLFTSIHVCAQYDQLAGVFVPPDSMDKKNTLILKLSRTNSLIQGERFQFNSIRIGVEHNKKYRFGLLLSSLADSFVVTQDLPDFASYNSISFFGFGGFWDFMVINNYRWEMSVPLEFGYGGFEYSYLDENHIEIPETDEMSYMMFLEIGTQLQYNFNNWLGFAIGGGVRTVAAGDRTIIEYTRGPFYTIGTRFLPGKFYQSVFHRKRVQETKKKYFEARKKAVEQRRRKP